MTNLEAVLREEGQKWLQFGHEIELALRLAHQLRPRTFWEKLKALFRGDTADYCALNGAMRQICVYFDQLSRRAEEERERWREVEAAGKALCVVCHGPASGDNPRLCASCKRTYRQAIAADHWSKPKS